MPAGRLDPGEGIEFVTCKLCGRAFKAINWPHLVHVHHLDLEHPVEEYKTLTGSAYTWSRETREKTITSRVAILEARGQHWTRERVLREIRQRYERGEPLTFAHEPDLAASVLVQMGRKLFGSWRAAVRAAGVDPDAAHLRIRWTRESVLDAIRAEHAAGRDLSCKAVTARFSALMNAARRQFGSWEAALSAAGVPSQRRARQWTRDAIVEALLKIGRGLTIKEIERRDSGLCHAIYRCFGSYEKAKEAAGLSVQVASSAKP